MRILRHLTFFNVIGTGFALTILAACVFAVWLMVTAMLSEADTLQDNQANIELQSEVERLKVYEELFNDHNLTLTYNGCEDMRERLGL